MRQIMDASLLIVAGHYGAGKTNLCLNLARDLRASEREVTLIDLDIVNPYFRSSDNLAYLQALGVSLLGPVHATNATNLDTPSLQPGIDDAIRAAGGSEAVTATGESGIALDKASAVLIDVGGDPDGARALGRYSTCIAAQLYQLLYVVNFNRPETAAPVLARENLRQIERTSGLRVTALVANTHLKQQTDVDGLLAALAPARELAVLAGVPLVAVTAPAELSEQMRVALAAQQQTVPATFKASDTPTPVELPEQMRAEVAAAPSATAASASDTCSVSDTPATAGSATPTEVYPVEIIVRTPWEEDGESKELSRN
jgi:hypothetical protein